MAATMKHRRSASKRRKTRGSNRYDKVLTRAKKIKKYGGSFLAKSKVSGKVAPAHRVSKRNSEYNSVKVTSEK